MQTTLTLKEDLKIPDEILQQFPFYISITNQLADNKLIQSMQNIFVSQMPSLSENQSAEFCGIPIAYAVGVILKILLDQDTKLIDELLQLARKQNDEKLIWAFQLIQYTVYSLYKSDIHLYLNIILNNKTIPKPPLNQDQVPLTASSIYSFVLLSEMHTFFQKIQLSQRIPYQCINDSRFKPKVAINLYQISLQQFPIVLVKYDEMYLQQHIWNKHVIFLKDVLLQLVMDATSTQQSSLVKKLKIQPYIVNSYDEFCQLLLVQDQDKLEQMLSNQHLINYFNKHLKSQDSIATVENIIIQLKQNIIDFDSLQIQQQQQQIVVKQQQEIFGLFSTQITKEKNGVQTVRFITKAK